ncbi:MAG: hypothetical protein EAZ92_02180, partial [Candidatus Kapaibacterium sp.]
MPQLYGQNRPLQAQLIVQPLQSPYISDYERSPNAMMITVVNPNQSEVQFKVSGSLKLLRQSRIVVSTNDEQTRSFSVPAGSSLTLLATDFLDRSSLNIAEQDVEAVLRSGRVPEGDYEICVKLIDPQRLTENVSSLIPCRQYRTQTPQATRLLAPMKENTITQPFPMFSWTPVMFSTGRTALYILTIAKIMGDQTPRQALESNIPLVKTEPLRQTSIPYPATAEPFSAFADATQIVWQVQAVDESGAPIGENDGRSEIWTAPIALNAALASTPPKPTPSTSQPSTPNKQPKTPPVAPVVQKTPLYSSDIFPAASFSGTVSYMFPTSKKIVPAPDVQITLGKALSRAEQSRSVLGGNALPETMGAARTNRAGSFAVKDISVENRQYVLSAKGRAMDTTLGTFSMGPGSQQQVALVAPLKTYTLFWSVQSPEGLPIKQATVRAWRLTDEFAFPGEGNTDGKETIENRPVLFKSSSDGAGKILISDFLISSNLQDAYTIEVTAKGYDPYRRNLRKEESGIFRATNTLTPAAAIITGMIVGSDRSRIHRAQITATVAIPEAGKVVVARGLSDFDGTFTLQSPPKTRIELPSGKGTLEISLAAGIYSINNGKARLLTSDKIAVQASKGTAFSPLTDVVLNERNEAELPYMTIEEGKMLTGTVLAQNGTPLAGARVIEAATGAAAVSGENGVFSLETSSAQTEVRLSRTMYKTQDVMLTDKQTIIMQPRTLSIKVKVIDALTSKPIAGASVIAQDSSAIAQSASDGIARVGGIPQYARSVTVFAKEYAVETVDFVGALSESDTSQVLTARLRAGGDVNGSVVGSDGKAFAGAIVTVQGYEDVLRVRTGNDGKFSFQHLPVGDNTVIARASGMLSAKAMVTVGKQPATVQLALKPLLADIRLLAGFPIALDDVRDAGAELTITGVITEWQFSRDFVPLTKELKFANVNILKTSLQNGKTNALPSNDKFELVDREIPMKVKEEFPAIARGYDVSGLLRVIVPEGKNKGFVDARMFLQFDNYVRKAPGVYSNVQELELSVDRPRLGKDEMPSPKTIFTILEPPVIEPVIEPVVAASAFVQSTRPTITSISRTTVRVGDTLTVRGTNLTRIISFTFGSIAGTIEPNGTATSFVVRVPANAGSAMKLTTQGGEVTASGSFTIALPPTITGISRTAVRVGDTLTVRGTNLSGIISFTFGSVAGTIEPNGTATSFVVRVPMNAGSAMKLTTQGGEVTASGSFTIALPPMIADIMPSNGKGGDTVRIKGMGLLTATEVRFGGIMVLPLAGVTGDSLRVIVPLGLSHGVSNDVTVMTNGGMSVVSPNTKFTSFSMPTITGIQPLSANVGADITIAGTFLRNVLVRFGGATVTAAPKPGGTEQSVTVTIPANAAAGSKVSVTTPGGTSPIFNNFTVTVPPSAPTITGIAIAGASVTSGKAGDVLTITGTNLTGAMSVTFGTVQAIPTGVTATSLRVTVPQNAGNGITVTTPGGTSPSSSLFTLLLPPTVSQVIPSVGKVGDTVSVVGSNLGEVTELSVGPAKVTILGD